MNFPTRLRNTNCLQLLKNIYDQKQAGRLCNQYLVQELLTISFNQSDIDKCVIYQVDVILFLCVYNGCFLCPSSKSAERAISHFKDAKKIQRNFDLEDRGDISDYLGINFAKTKDGNIKLTQPQLIGHIISEVGVDTIRRIKPTPSASTKIIYQDIKSASFDHSFNYVSVVGIINYLEKGSSPYIAYSVQQCAIFSPTLGRSMMMSSYIYVYIFK